MTNTFNKYIGALVAMWGLATASIHAQSYIVHKKDGSKTYYPASNTRDITLYGFNANITTAKITLTAGDVWSDGSGYQMLLDADATAYGSLIPASAPLTSSGDADATLYDEFEYKIPENADGSLSTANIVCNNSVTITIPAGTYDWCIVNPTPGDRIWIAGSSGSVAARQDNYVFEAGKAYEFTVSKYSSSDGVDVSITSAQPTGIRVNKMDGTFIKMPSDSLECVEFVEDDNPLRIQIWSYVVGDTRYTLYKEPDENAGQPNSDGNMFYKSELTLDMTKDGETATYVVDDNIYLSKEVGENEGQTPCVAIDFISNNIYLFANPKTKSRNYYEYGFFYISSLSNISFQRETVFSDANWGWYPYFTYDDGVLSVQHFSFNGYYAMTSTRNSSNSWSTQKGSYIKPDAFVSQWKANGSLLVIRPSGDNGGSNDDGHAYVDLGLPSGTLWATCNIGASSPEEYGDYFAWGETEPKDYYDWTNYHWAYYGYEFLTKYCTDSESGIVDNITELETSDDAATVIWGDNWQTPSFDQLKELLSGDYTTISHQYDGNGGSLITSNANGNSIFLPHTGIFKGSDTISPRAIGYYWSRDMPESSAYGSFVAWTYLVGSSNYSNTEYRYKGCNIRPVRK